MAASNFITVNTSKALGAQALAIRNSLANLKNQVDNFSETLAQVNADGNLMSLLGTTSADNATGIYTLIGSLDTELSSGTMLQVISRIGQADS